MPVAEYLQIGWVLTVVATGVYVEHPCPKGARVHLVSLRCYWLKTSAASWPEASDICQRTQGAQLAGVDSAKDQIYILGSFPSKAPMWVWLSRGPRQVGGAGTDTRPALEGGTDGNELCPQMSLGSVGRWRNFSCGEEYPFICEMEAADSLPSTDTFLVGVPLMSGVYSLVQAPALSTSPDIGQHRVEMMLFPGLWFSHQGQVLSVEFVMNPRKSRTQAKVQILRPYCSPNQHLIPPGCNILRNPFCCCFRAPLCNTTGGCASGHYWCHLLESCLPVTSPCSPYQSPASGRSYALPPRYPAATPFYHLVANVPLNLPPSSEPLHVRMALSEQGINIYPDDILAVQHTERKGGFLHCLGGLDSPWRQSYLSLQGPEWGGWLEGGVSSLPADAQWFDGLVCDLRVLYVDAQHGYGVSLPVPGTSRSGPGGRAQAESVVAPGSSILSPMPSPVSRLCIAHPRVDKEGHMHIAVNATTFIVLRMLPGTNATSSWSAPILQTGILFSPSCPPEPDEPNPGCDREGADPPWCSQASLVLPSPGSHVLNVSVWNSVDSPRLSVQLHAHLPVAGLSILPHGDRRMLVDVPQEFTAMVKSGSSVKYTWVVDDLVRFAYEGQTYSVVFKKPADYMLKVSAENPVSSLSQEVKLTADTMAPLADPAFLSVGEVIASSAAQVFTFRVKVDVSVGVTFWWSFGDDSPGVNHSLPSLCESRGSQLEPGVRQIYLQDSISHTYLHPDDYTLTVKVSSPFEQIEKAVLLKVRSPLTRLHISPTPPVPCVNQTFHLEALPWPSPFQILYTWSFGDGSHGVKGFDRKVSHLMRAAGVYNLTVRANNTLSSLAAWLALEIVENITGLRLVYDGPTELGLITVVMGYVSTGTGLRWTFDMGDGSVLENFTDSSVSHVYKSPGMYTVRVIASNPVGQAGQSIGIEVYKLTIGGILPSVCLLSGRQVDLRALVAGNVSVLTFHWNFGDKTPVSIIPGNATVAHLYSSPGNYQTNVTVFSSVGSASYQTHICTEAPISALSLCSSKEVVAVGDEVCLSAVVRPSIDHLHSYQFLWYNTSRHNHPVSASANYCLEFKEEGIHQVSVVVSNRVSDRTAKAFVPVHRPVSGLTAQSTAPDSALVVNKPYSFWVETISGTNVTVLWDFGDGTAGEEGQNLTHVFTSAGRYEIITTASNAVSRDSVTSQVIVMVPVSDLELQTKEPITLLGEEVVIVAVTDVMLNVSFYWSVDSSFPPKLGSSNFTYVFTKAGVYQIHVTVQNLVSKREATMAIEVLEKIQGVHITGKSLISMKYIPTRESVILNASVMRGSNLTYHWQVNPKKHNKTAYVGEHFQLFTEAPGDILVELTASNRFGKVNKSLSLRAVDRVSGAVVSTGGDTLPVRKPVEISVSVGTGTDLQYLWLVGYGVSPLSTSVPLLRHIFSSSGSFVIRVSVSNVLGSAEATKRISVQEDVHEVGFKINGKLNPFFVPSRSEQLFLGSIEKGSDLNWEWKRSSESGGSSIIGNMQTVVYSFLDAGVYQVSLNASNDISWQTVSHVVTVQETIQGFTLNTSSHTACVNDPIVFTPLVSKGSNVHFSLEFDIGNLSVNLVQKDFTTSALPIGNHTVTTRAWNKVSSAMVSSPVQVVEKVQGLRLINCCSVVLESRKEVSFRAEVLHGAPDSYQWSFHLAGFQSTHATGSKVIYRPPRNGLLTVTVTANNGFCLLSVRDVAIVQCPVQHIRLVSNTTGYFVNQSIAFSALTDGGSDLRFKWDFGTSAEGLVATDSHKALHQFHIPGRYIVQVTVFNNISHAVAQLPVEVRKLECAQPRVSLVQEKVTIPMARHSYFEARVDLQGCVAYKTSYLWEAFHAPRCDEEDRVPLAGVADVTLPLLGLPKHALPVGSYCLRFTVLLLGTPLLRHRSASVTVVHSQLVAQIKGGSQRVWSSHRDLLLDATESYDPDTNTGDGEPLQYRWECVVENTTDLCFLGPPAHSNGGTFTVSHKVLQPGRVYLFTLTVQKAGRLPASTTQSVAVQEGQMLPVSLECVSCRRVLSYRFSHGHSVALSGHCQSCKGNIKYTWSAESWTGDLLELNEVTTTTGPNSADLVVRPGVLLDGLNYTFSLNVCQPTLKLWGLASLTLLPNHPPRGGVCTLTPEDALRLLETVVTFHCSGWTDEGWEPAHLVYTLKAEVCQERGRSCRLHTLYRGTQRTYGTLVPAGPSAAGNNLSIITVLVQVEDNLGAAVTALNRTLTVSVPEGGQGLTEWLKNKSQAKLWALVQQGNPQEVLPYSLALSSQLNQVGVLSERERRDRVEMRANVTRMLASLPVSSLQDAAQISSALALCTAFPREGACEDCQMKVLEATEKMITVIGQQAEPGDVTTIDTGRNILHVLGSAISAAAEPLSAPEPHNHSEPLPSPETAVSALGQVGELMRLLMRSRLRGEEPLSLVVPQISAVGRRGGPAHLLCSGSLGPRPFHVPPGLSSQLFAGREEVVQILLGLDGEGPLPTAARPPISTALAAMEFATPQGSPIPVTDLSPDQAIRVTLPSHHSSWEPEQKEGGSPTVVSLLLPPQGSLNFTVRAVVMEPQAGLFLAFNFSLLPGTGTESNGLVKIMVDDQPAPSLARHSHLHDLQLSLSAESPAVENTIFLTPLLNGSGRALHVNLSSSLTGGEVRASVCVFSSLCQYFSPELQHWSSEGLRPLAGSSPREAHCLTQHLTLFGASLFVHPGAIVLLPPAEHPTRNAVVGIVCGVLLLLYLLMALIAHKLDHLDSVRLSSVPLCGQPGRYQYRVLVKTGWAGGSGTTAHVGISLYGLNKSGSRHLQRDGAFRRSSLDDFQVETDANLGEIWKIRIWHDNTGLDPSWYLQHVIVWDRQTDNLFFFLVEDWLSVENEKNQGMVEKEVLASCPQELQQFGRVLRAQLAYGMLERHIWVSVWERPSHSSFTRAQRVTCCALLLHLYLAAAATWYGAVGDKGASGPLSDHLPVTAESVAMGMTVAVLVFPLQLVFCILFRKTSSRVTVEESPSSTPVSQTVEMDVYLDRSETACSSFLSLPRALSSTPDGASHSAASLGSKDIESQCWNTSTLGSESETEQWLSCDSIFQLPELSGEPALGQARLLRRKKAQLQLCLLGSPGLPPEQPPSLSHAVRALALNAQQPNLLTLSEEDLIKTIAADTDGASSSSSGRVTSDSGRYSPRGTTLSENLESSCSSWSELSQGKPPYGSGLRKSPSSASVFTDASTFLPSPFPDSADPPSTTRIGVARGPPRWLLPSWMLGVTYLLAGLVLGGCLALVGMYGSGLSSSALLMWLISAASAFLTSAMLLEPLTVFGQALFLATVVRPVDPEVEERLEQEPMVKRGSVEQGGKVRPPCGYGLLHAKEEARKVRTLTSLMKNCVVHMLFLLVVLLLNYQNSVHDTQIRLLHAAAKQSLLAGRPGALNLSKPTGVDCRWAEVWEWMDKTLVPYIHQNPSLLLVGLPRLQRVQSHDGCCFKDTDYLALYRGSSIPAVSITTHVPSGDRRGSVLNGTNGRQSPWPRPCWVPCRGGQAVELGNSSELTRLLLSELQGERWVTSTTRAMSVEFTHYHRETALFVIVTVLMEWPRSSAALAFISTQPFHMPSSSSGPDLQIATVVLLLLFALSFLGHLLWTTVRERCRPSLDGRRCLQLLAALLSLAIGALRLAFLSISASCLAQHRSSPQSFVSFRGAALLADVASQLSALLLTLLVLKMVGPLRFVRRWVVFGQVLQQAWRELCAVALFLFALLLLFTHVGSMLFSHSVEGFGTAGQAALTLVSALRGRGVIGRLCDRHPTLGPLYCLSLLAVGLWGLGRLCGALLLRSYRAALSEMYRPAIDPQDYEMVEFFVKRLKLWMGLIKTKKFRHKVKFEGMVLPPSRSSQWSQLSGLEVPSPAGLRLASALSLGSEDSSLSDGYDVQYYLDRLLPSVDGLLTQFERVNRVTDDLHNMELELLEAQNRISERRRQRRRTEGGLSRGMTSSASPRVASPSSSLIHPPTVPPFLTRDTSLPRARSTCSESAVPWQKRSLCEVPDAAPPDRVGTMLRASGTDVGFSQGSGRRAWHSSTSHSADTAQRLPQVPGVDPRVRPRSEEGKRRLSCDRLPVKRRAWHPDEPEIVKDV